MKVKGKIRKLTSHEEYEACKNGLNIVFGAMIGVIMGRIEEMNTFNYCLLIALVSAFVMTLLYVTSSKRRIFYLCVNSVILFLGWINATEVEAFLNIDPNLFEQRLLPVASVWLVLVALVEFMPRERPETAETNTAPKPDAV